MAEPLLDVQGLRTVFRTITGTIPVLDDVSFALARTETLGIVGESGCGKSITARALMRLIEFENGAITAGSIRYAPEDGGPVEITALPHNSARMRAIRGAGIAMIFQEPMASFNPVFTIGQQMTETLRYHLSLSRREARDRAIEMLARVRIPNPARRVDEHPHEFSGGMRQRAMIAMAISCNPRLLIADEPTTALDVTVEAQILDLLHGLTASEGMSTLIITHDMAVISEMSDHVMVMYAGRVVEYGSVDQVLDAPLHPYTQGLLRSIPQIGQKGELHSIEGSVPNLLRRPPGCHFAPRCHAAMPRCRETPPNFAPESGRRVRCWLHEGPTVEAPPPAPAH